MPGCAAVGCNNRSEKGYIMKCFPRDPKLRKIWQERVARADWEPSNNSFLCHVHFEPQEWSITQSGRIRLKKYAVPSIFTITSTRKSPKKKTKLTDIQREQISQGNYSIDYLENDTEYSSAGHLEEKDSDFQDTDGPPVSSVDKKFVRHITKSTDFQMDFPNPASRTDTIKEEDVKIDLSEVKESNKLAVTKSPVKSPVKSPIPCNITKEEVKIETMGHNVFDDSYDEIEEKLKQICDGGSTEDDNKKNEIRNLVKDDSKDDKERSNVDCDLNNTDRAVTAPVAENHNFSTKTEVGHILTNKQENVEIIFGAESGDEKITVYQSIPHNKHIAAKIDKVEDNTLEDDIICKKEEKKVFNEDIEENFAKDEVHVIPNIRAAMKRKRRTREEIMKSIKKTIRSTSDQDVNSSSNSDLSESIENEVKGKNESPKSLQKIRRLESDNGDMETAKFVIKVTGDPDDVTEIIEELSSSAVGTEVPEKISTHKNTENDAFVTSIITVLSAKNSKELNDSDTVKSPLEKEECISKQKVIDQSLCDEKDILNLEMIHSPIQSSYFRHPWSDDEGRSQIMNTTQIQNCTHNSNTSLGHSSLCTPCDYEELLERVKIQEDVIAKLTDQIIIYKELENNLRNKSIGREIQTKEAETVTHRINTRSSNVQSTVVNKKNLESKQRLIEDLSNRVNYFEEMNKKLMKTVTLESQQKRKLEGQIKQKDNRIKELNWKLEKAAKYLERAEKNTNTYRRKMLNMQTIMRRRKLLDEKMNKFNEMLSDNSKLGFSEKIVTMAAEIRKTCGKNGYDKLLSYGFPLPPLPILRKDFFSDDFTDYNESDVDKMHSKRTNIKIDEDMKSEIDMEVKDSELSGSVNKPTEFDGAETITGTVQDIFDENNDGDDFSTNELREHFILQLNAVM